MAWVKLDDGFFNNRKIVSIGKDAKLLYLAGLCYAGSALTDGEVPSNAVPILAAQTGVKATAKAVNDLVRANLWTKTDGGFAIMNYLEYNTSSGEVQAKRDAARERMERARSQNVRANKTRTSDEQDANTSRSSREVRSTRVRASETETETETELLTEREGTALARPHPLRCQNPLRSQGERDRGRGEHDFLTTSR